MEKTGIRVGHTEKAGEAINEMMDKILRVVECPAADDVKVAALNAMGDMSSIQGTMATNCHIDMSEHHHHHADSDEEENDKEENDKEENDEEENDEEEYIPDVKKNESYGTLKG